MQGVLARIPLEAHMVGCEYLLWHTVVGRCWLGMPCSAFVRGRCLRQQSAEHPVDAGSV